MNIKTICIFAIGAVLALSPVVYADDNFGQEVEDTVEYEDYADYEDYEVFEDVSDLIDEELSEPVEVVEDIEPEVVNIPAPRAVAERLSCDEISNRIADLRIDVKSYPELRTDLEYMLSRQRSQCAPRATRRPVHNYNNVNPVKEVEIPQVEENVDESLEPEKTPEEIAAEAAAAEAERQAQEVARLAQIEENFAKGLCGDGKKPNKYGCCVGEVFKQLEHLDFACCPKDGDGECREPFKK